MNKLLDWAPVQFGLEVAQLYFRRHVSRSAAALAYFLLLSFFPVLICINAFVGLLRLDVGAVVEAASAILPRETLGILADYMGYITTNQSPALLLAGAGMTLFSASAAFRTLMRLLAGAGMTLVSASAAFRVLMHAMEELYGRRGRRGVRRLAASAAFPVLLLLTVYLAAAVLLTGEWLFTWLARKLRLPPELLPWQWQWFRFLLLFLLVFLFVLLAYRMAAPGGVPRPPVVAGALLAAAALVAATALFSRLIGLSARYSLVYGSLASVVILLVWLYLCGNLLILGCAFSCVRHRRREGKHPQNPPM